MLLVLTCVVVPLLRSLSGDRRSLLNDNLIDFKSHQWFGATVRSHGDTILVSPAFFFFLLVSTRLDVRAEADWLVVIMLLLPFTVHTPSPKDGVAYCVV